MSRAFGRVSTVAVVLLATLSIASPMALAASIVVSPPIVAPGGRIRLSGDVLAPDGTPGCEVPATVTLISDAFAGLGEFAGLGAVMLPVDATAHFDSTVTLSATVPVGTYQITGRCGGGNLGVQATLEVRGLAATGPANTMWPTVAVAFGLVIGGLALVIIAIRRQRPGAA
jgi:hypothetical protein